MVQESEVGKQALATALWRSGVPAGKDLDIWLASESMIVQAARARREVPAASRPPRSLEVSAAPVGRIRDLAYAFWDRAGRPGGMALAFWLAAERHVLAACRAVLAGGTPGSWSADGHCARLGERARLLWERAGRPENRDVHFWLAAEAEVLAELACSAANSMEAANLPLATDSTGAEAWRM